MTRIYMDAHATTPVDPRVREEMLPYFTETFGNPASRTHVFGREAARAVEEARERVARLVGADPSEVVFTSGATESDNLAIKGVAEAAREKGRDHLVTVRTEHRAVLEACRALERQGRARVTYLPVGRDGLLDPDDLRRALTDRTALVSVMTAHNEIGVLQPVGEIARICRERGVLFHTDAAQAVGKIPFDVRTVEADLVSFTAHKLYGPKGVGVLLVRRRRPRIRLVPLLDGGGHEQGLRPGTLPVPLIVGFGRACAIAAAEMPEESRRILALRERLRKLIFEGLDDVFLNGALEPRLPGNLNVSFAGVEGESLIAALGDVAVSSGSACGSALRGPSHVLEALGIDEPLAHAAIRFGLGRFNTEAEVDEVGALLRQVVPRLRALSPAYQDRRGGRG